MSVTDRAARREAKQKADGLADQELGKARLERLNGLHAQQDQANHAWTALNQHDPEVVMAELEDAFEDNQHPAACVGAFEDDSQNVVTVVLLFGTPQMVPERRPDTTPSGNPTLKKRNKTDRNAWYTAALGSAVFATVKEAFAVSPATDEVRLLVMRRDPEAMTPNEYVTPIYTARFPRESTLALPWSNLDPAETLLGAPDANLRRKGQAKDVVPIDVSKDPDLNGVVEQMRNDLWSGDTLEQRNRAES